MVFLRDGNSFTLRLLAVSTLLMEKKKLVFPRPSPHTLISECVEQVRRLYSALQPCQRDILEATHSVLIVIEKNHVGYSPFLPYHKSNV